MRQTSRRRTGWSAQAGGAPRGCVGRRGRWRAEGCPAVVGQHTAGQTEVACAVRETNLAADNNLGAVWGPCQGEGLLADSDLADAGLGAYVPEAEHAICAAACKLVLVDWVEGDALELCRGGRACCAQLC